MNKMQAVKVLKSTIDKSVNWVLPVYKNTLIKNQTNPINITKYIETRYVRRRDDYISGYVSSSIGCNMGCKFCFLTQQGQTDMMAVTPSMFADQLKIITEHYKTKDFDNKCKRMNINFMARGDAFANKYIVNKFPDVYDALDKVCSEAELKMKLNISTIMPHTVRHKALHDIFQDKPAYLYYSLYSTNDAFRKKWMPNAMHWRQSLDKLKEYQDNGGNIITFHWAFIDGENDNMEDIMNMASVLQSYNFNAKLNIVRYNNHPNLPNKETPIEKINDIFNIINCALNNNSKSRIVPRVDIKTFASCGTFINDDDL